MASISEALASINQGLESARQSKKDDMQFALAMMQFQSEKAYRKEETQRQDFNARITSAENRLNRYQATTSSRLVADLEQIAGEPLVMGTDENKGNYEDWTKSFKEKWAAEGGGANEASRIMGLIYRYKANPADPGVTMDIMEHGRTMFQRYQQTKRKGAADPNTKAYGMHGLYGNIFSVHLESGEEIVGTDEYLTQDAKRFFQNLVTSEDLRYEIDREIQEMESEGDYEIQTQFGVPDPFKYKPPEAGETDFDTSLLDDFEESKEWQYPGIGEKGVVIAGSAMLASEYGRYSKGMSDYLKAIETNLKSKAQGGMTPAKFKQEYGRGKIDYKAWSKTKEGTKAITKLARDIGLGKTTTAEAYQAIKNMKYVEKIGKVMSKIGGNQIITYATPSLAKGVGGFVAGETGEVIGQTAGTGYFVWNTILKPNKMSFKNFMFNRAPAVAAKMGIMAASDSPALLVMDFVALGYGAYEIYNTVKLYQKYLED